MNEKDDLRGVLERGNYTEMAAGEFNSAVAAQLKSYHPHDGTERCFRLDVGNDSVRKKVLAVTSDSRLDQVFDDEAE